MYGKWLFSSPNHILKMCCNLKTILYAGVLLALGYLNIDMLIINSQDNNFIELISYKFMKTKCISKFGKD